MAVPSEEAKRKLLKEKIENRRHLEKKSLESIEALLERNINETQLLGYCNYLWQQSYQDCTEERALGELCGYPLCDNPVAPQSQKLPKYKICTRTKKVYSTEKQRVFCCVRCFEQSEWLKSQLSEIPLWMLETPYQKKISLYRQKGDSPADVELDGNLLPHSERISANEVERLSQDFDDAPLKSCPMETREGNNVSRPRVQAPPPPLPPPPSNLNDSLDSEVFNVDKIEKLLCEWFTIDSLDLIVGRDRFLELRAQHDRGVTPPNQSLDEKMAQYLRLCSLLDEQEKLEGLTYSDEDEEPTEKSTQPKQTRQKSSAKKTRRKKVTIAPDSISSGQAEVPGDAEDTKTPDVPEPVLPPVDKHQQKLLREKVLLDRLSPLVESSSCLIRTPAHVLAKDISQLIHTFYLTRENCLIRHDEVVIVFIVIMMLLDRKTGGEGQIPQELRNALDAPLRKAGLAWGDLREALRKATDPRRLFNPQKSLPPNQMNDPE